MNKSELIGALNSRKESLMKELNEIKEKVNQIVTIREQLIQNILKIQGSITEIDNTIKLLESNDNDSDNRTQEESDINKE